MPNLSDEEFSALWHKAGGSPAEVSRLSGIGIRAIYARRNTLTGKGYHLPTIPAKTNPVNRLPVPKIGYRRNIEIKGGTVVIGSDSHSWPGERSIAFDALVKFIESRKPSLVVFNGDALDGAKISRHAPGGWAALPDLADELAAVQERLGEIEIAAGGDIPLVLCAGNHDSRFSARLAQMAPDFIRVHGTDLADHLPQWQFCWSLWINDDVVVKHRWHGGQHAQWNNVLKSGKTMVTGHTHRLGATRFEDYNPHGRWGIECGTLMEIGTDNDKLSWTEDNPLNWHPGFVVLTFTDTGVMLEPEFARVIDGRCYFRGEPI